VFFAHSTPDAGQSDWQELAAHLRAVSDLAGPRFVNQKGESALPK